MSAPRAPSSNRLASNPFGVISKLIRFLLSRGLLSEGLFTLASTDPEVASIRKRLAVETDDADLSTWTRSATAVSVLLLEHLRSLPEPLLTFDKYDSFLMTEYIKDSVERNKYRKTLIEALPVAYLNATTQLLTLLNRLKNNEISNHISISTLVPVFATLFLRPAAAHPYMTDDQPRVFRLVSDLIADYNIIFPDGDSRAKVTSPTSAPQKSLIREDSVSPPSSPRRSKRKPSIAKKSSAASAAASPYIIVMSGGKSARKKHVRQSSIEITRRASRNAISTSDEISLDESTIEDEEDEEDVEADLNEETGNESSSQHSHIVLESASTSDSEGRLVFVKDYPVF